MPQSNPTIPKGKSSEQIATGLATGDFELVPAATEDWFIRKIFTIPAEFTSIEFVMHHRTIDSSGVPIIYWFSNMTPGEDTVTWFDSQTVQLASGVGGGGANYPNIFKMGIGPIYDGVSTNVPGGDPISDPDFVPLTAGLGANQYINTTISSPIQMIYTLSQTPAGTRPTLDATVYHTFYK